MAFFKYGKKQTAHLKQQDRKLGEAIDAIGLLKREVNPDLFSALINSIVGQQISSKAQETVWNRMTSSLGVISPNSVLSQTEAELQSYG
ncbi:MAG: DNA-3-methyladenine glycosylase 2 family protein, partial [Treponema sp.]|nr:DNA-3-methyladenine glycosylase 2 family protein [Treponema sp.]